MVPGRKRRDQGLGTIVLHQHRRFVISLVFQPFLFAPSVIHPDGRSPTLLNLRRTGQLEQIHADCKIPCLAFFSPNSQNFTLNWAKIRKRTSIAWNLRRTAWRNPGRPWISLMTSPATVICLTRRILNQSSLKGSHNFHTRFSSIPFISFLFFFLFLTIFATPTPFVPQTINGREITVIDLMFFSLSSLSVSSLSPFPA